MISYPLPPGVIEKLRTARRISALTGAGISAESGVPTFRDAQTGLWAKYDPQELATPEAFRRDPRLVWEWYAWRRELVSAAKPNPGHLALAEMERLAPSFTLITQNVDGLHRTAGSRNVIELHGNLFRTRCQEEGASAIFSIDQIQGREKEIPPRCPNCGGLLRPDVVWFGEILPQEALRAAWEAAGSCEAFFSIGTSGMVEPAASLPLLAMQNGATVIEINLGKTPLTSHVTCSMQGPAGVILPEIVRAIWLEANV
jgi:NAD-dependent deacetylase